VVPFKISLREVFLESLIKRSLVKVGWNQVGYMRGRSGSSHAGPRLTALP
jgi:hypothetical protein